MTTAKISVLLVDEFKDLGDTKLTEADRRQKVLRLKAIPEGSAMDEEDVTPGQLIAVSGVVRPTIFKRELNTDIYCVSIPGINFAYSEADQKKFIGIQENVIIQGSKEGLQIRKFVNEEGQIRMRQIWHHALSCFQKGGVTCPVLCAIGCGAFNDKTVENIPLHWANTLAECLQRSSYGHGFLIRVITKSMPTASNR